MALPIPRRTRPVTIVLSPQEAQRLAELAARFDQLNEIERSEWYQLWVATVPRAIDSYYSLATPSAVPLYAGPLLFPAPDDGTSEQADGTVSLELAPRPRVLMRGPAPSLIDFQNLLDGARNPRLPPCPRCRLHLPLRPRRITHRGLGPSGVTSSASRQQHAP